MEASPRAFSKYCVCQICTTVEGTEVKTQVSLTAENPAPLLTHGKSDRHKKNVADLKHGPFPEFVEVASCANKLQNVGKAKVHGKSLELARP